MRLPPESLAAGPVRSAALPAGGAQAEQALRPANQMPLAPSAPPLPPADQEPSAPPASTNGAAPGDAAPSAPQALVDEAEVLRQAVQTFFESAAAHELLSKAASQILRTSLAPDVRRAERALLKLRAQEEAALQYQARWAAAFAVRSAVDAETKKVHGMMREVAWEAARESFTSEVPRSVQQSPLVHELLREHRARVAREAGRVADREFAEICDENRYHRVSKAFLQTLENRSKKTVDKILSKSFSNNAEISQRATTAENEMSARVQKAGMVPMLLSVAALVGSALSVALPASRL